MSDDQKKVDEISKELDDIKSRYKTVDEEQKDYDENKDDTLDGYSLGLHLLVSVLVCTGIGAMMDKYFQTGGLLTVLMVAVGFCSGIWQIWKKFRDME